MSLALSLSNFFGIEGAEGFDTHASRVDDFTCEDGDGVFESDGAVSGDEFDFDGAISRDDGGLLTAVEVVAIHVGDVGFGV